jgi:hypothetical protein
MKTMHIKKKKKKKILLRGYIFLLNRRSSCFYYKINVEFYEKQAQQNKKINIHFT